MIPDGEYEIDVSSLLLPQKPENFGIRYVFRPDSIDGSQPMEMVRDSGESHILRAHVDSKRSDDKYVFFEGGVSAGARPQSSLPSSPALAPVGGGSTEYLLIYDRRAKDFKLEPLKGGVLKMNKTRNPEKLSKRFGTLRTEALRRQPKRREFTPLDEISDIEHITPSRVQTLQAEEKKISTPQLVESITLDEEEDWEENLDDWEAADPEEEDTYFKVEIEEAPLKNRSRRGSEAKVAQTQVSERTRRRTSEILQREEVRSILTPELNKQSAEEDVFDEDDFDKAIDSFEEEEKRKYVDSEESEEE